MLEVEHPSIRRNNTVLNLLFCRNTIGSAFKFIWSAPPAVCWAFRYGEAIVTGLDAGAPGLEVGIRRLVADSWIAER